jgi:predicted RNase H-like nuclease (RuvC/YqgF family)
MTPQVLTIAKVKAATFGFKATQDPSTKTVPVVVGLDPGAALGISFGTTEAA